MIRAARMSSCACLLASVAVIAESTHEPKLLAQDYTLLVRIVNYAKAPEWQLRPMRGHVDRAFRAIGVHVAWRDDRSLDPLDPSTLTVALLSPAMIANKVRVEQIPDNVLARSARGVQHAWVFYERVVKVPQHSMLDLGTALGRVLVHEIGHLLIPDGKHSGLSAMRPTLDIQTASVQRFTRDEGESIRATMRARGVFVELAQRPVR